MLLSLLLLSSGLTEVRAFTWSAVTGNDGGSTAVYVNNFDWQDQWGWCISEDRRVELGTASGRKECLAKCEQQKWNDKYPRGCEYSGNYRTCNVFFGARTRSAQKGSSYRCNINIARGVSFTSSKTETGDEQAVGFSWGATTGNGVATKSLMAYFKCTDDYISTGVGSVTRTNYEGCSERFRDTGKMFVYYAGSQHCQETKAHNTQYNKGWKVCVPLKAEKAVGEATCACSGGNQKGTKNGDKVCQWRGGNCSKFREGCDMHGATICEMQKVDLEQTVGDSSEEWGRYASAGGYTTGYSRSSSSWESDDMAMAMELPSDPVSLLTYGFAVIGVGFMVFQGVQTWKKHTEYSSLVVEQEI